VAQTKEKVAVDSAKVTVVGRLGKDPESRETRNGKRITNAPIAIGQRKKNTAGNWEDDVTMWFQLTAFGSDLDEFAKGDKVTAAGRLTMSEWEDREGKTRQSYEILVDSVSLVSKPKPKQDTEVAEDEYPD
jgi:single-strand DNA-binding protein